MRSLPLLLLLPLAACAAPENLNLEAGDRYYRMGQFHDAYLAYSAAENPTEETRLLIKESRFHSILLSAQDLIHRNQVAEALGLLDFLEAERPGYAKTTELRDYAYRRHAAQLCEDAELQLDDGEAAAAADAYRTALRWDATNAEAKRGLKAAMALHGDRVSRGEQFYFAGLKENSEGHTTQARTSFSHASNLLGEGSKASDRLRAFSQGEAIVQLERGRVHLEGNRMGAAWVALMDAVRLDPSNQDAAAMLDRVAANLEALRLMNEAEVHVLGSRSDQADVLLNRVLEITDQRNKQVDVLRQKAQYRRSLDDYRLARALELDSQIVRALGLYQAIQKEATYGFEDVPLRTENLEARVESAKSLYTKALEAQKAGDAAAYRENLSKTLGQAGDYKDALERFQAVQ